MGSRYTRCGAAPSEFKIYKAPDLERSSSVKMDKNLKRAQANEKTRGVFGFGGKGNNKPGVRKAE